MIYKRKFMKKITTKQGPADTLVIWAGGDVLLEEGARIHGQSTPYSSNGVATVRCICCGGPVHATALH